MEASFSRIYKAMKTVKPIEEATDAQLRQLAARFAWCREQRDIIDSELPMLTTERAELVNLLASNNIHQFAL